MKLTFIYIHTHTHTRTRIHTYPYTYLYMYTYTYTSQHSYSLHMLGDTKDNVQAHMTLLLTLEYEDIWKWVGQLHFGFSIVVIKTNEDAKSSIIPMPEPSPSPRLTPINAVSSSLRDPNTFDTPFHMAMIPCLQIWGRCIVDCIISLREFLLFVCSM